MESSNVRVQHRLLEESGSLQLANQFPPISDPANPPVFRLLFFVHTRQIRDDACSTFMRHFLSMGFVPSAFLVLDEYTNSSEIREAQFIFCLFQSADRIPEEVLSTTTHVIFDECHHLLAKTYRMVYEKLICQKSLLYCVGMTATRCHRTDPQGSELLRLFRECLYVDYPWTRAKQLGHFPRVEYLEFLPTLRGLCEEKEEGDLIESVFP